MSAGHLFILGGARSGKTAFGEALALRLGCKPAYLATAEARDEEMKARVAAHRTARADRFTTIEEPIDIVGASVKAARAGHDIVLIDCLTLWLSNLLEQNRDIAAETGRLAEALRQSSGVRVILISNEVGLGIVPDNALSRAFRDHSGRMNQTIASAVSSAYFVVAGLPLVLKGVAPDHL